MKYSMPKTCLKFTRNVVSIPLALLGIAAQASADVDTLFSQFHTPPQSAAPHAWWHWMNGDINAEQAKADLEWMAQIGLGGVQVFDAGLGSAAANPLAFGSAPWREAMRVSAAKAQQLGLDYVITTSPGWSATGGPWVEPADAMKKLVWSEVVVTGGKLLELKLPRPAAEAGPFQDIPLEAIGHASHPIAPYYRDSKVLAVPVSAPSATSQPFTLTNHPDIAGALQDGQFWPAQSLNSDDKGNVYVDLRFAHPVTAYGVTLGLPGARGFGSPNPPVADWQVCQSPDNCQSLAVLEATRSLTRTAAFTPVSSRYFRLHLKRSQQPGFIDTMGYVDGAIKLPFPAYTDAYALSEIRVHTQPVVHAFEEKAGFAAAPRYYPLDTPETIEAQVKSAHVIDISQAMDANGVLRWQAPVGNWQIIRFGFGLTGHENGPAQLAATGLEADKLDAGRIMAYMQDYLANFRDESGELYSGITGLLSDSIESGPQNWSDNLLSEFAATVGYDPLPYLPALTGIVIDSPQQSDRFLWDFRHFLAEQLTQAHYATLAAIAKQNGLSYYSEALEDHRPQLGNDLDIRALATIPMAAFWFFEAGKQPKPTYVADVKGAASVATLQGGKIVAVEAMTTFGHPWAVGPKELRAAADRAFVTGANRLMLHSSVHQSVGLNHTTGKSMMPLLGHYFNRNNTWADFAKPWISYLSRSQYLLQQGYPSASFSYFIGEEAPVTSLFGDKAPSGIPAGYDYDFISAQGLSTLTVDQDGSLLTRSGTRYQFLYLGGDSQRMTNKTLQQLTKLASQGAMIAGLQPTSSPSLNDDQYEFQRLAKTLWSSDKVIPVASPAQAIARLQLAPQWQLNGDDGQVQVEQRTLQEGQLYYLVNTADKSLKVTLSLPFEIRQAWLLDAVDGAITSADMHSSQHGIPLQLAANQSLFVLANNAANSLKTVLKPKEQGAATQGSVTTIDGPWTISFDPRFASHAPVTTEKLTAISSLENPQLHGFSGISSYTSHFELSDSCQHRALLSLSEVGDIAQVMINQHEAGYLWTPPYQLDISHLLQAGNNHIDIKVANYWANQLISQAQQKAPQAGFPLGVYRPDAPLRMAGLRGSMTLRCEE